MELKIQKEPKGFTSASRSRLGLASFNVVDEAGTKIGAITGDQLKAQLNHYNFDVIDLRSRRDLEKLNQELNDTE